MRPFVFLFRRLTRSTSGQPCTRATRTDSEKRNSTILSYFIDKAPTIIRTRMIQPRVVRSACRALVGINTRVFLFGDGSGQLIAAHLRSYQNRACLARNGSDPQHDALSGV